MKTLVVIPTYNERENIVRLLPEVLKVADYIQILVVDDSSPDGTGHVVQSSPGFGERVHLLSRPKKSGLGRAYLAGFDWALQKKYDCIVEMDADFSHRTADLKKLLDYSSKADFLVGSRYVKDGATVNWGLIRKLISRFGSLYAKTILGFPLRDWTGGFNFWHARVLSGIELATVQSEGYCFQIELKFRALRQGFVGLEVPIIFEDRRVGQSKMSSRIVLEALYKVWRVRLWKAKK